MDFYWTSVLFGGFASFASPCVLPLVVPYLSYMSGVSVEDLRAEKGHNATVRFRIVFTALAFVLGFTLVFVGLGAGATTIGGFLHRYQDYIATAAAIVIIIMGLNFLGVFRLAFLSREARFQTSAKPASLGGAFLMGFAFAFGWTPCVGPILGPILTYAGSQENVMDGAGLLAIYSLGLGIPFLLAAIFSNLFMRFFMRFKRYLGVMEKVIGIMLIITGILFLTGSMQTISYWFLDTFPALNNLG